MQTKLWRSYAVFDNQLTHMTIPLVKYQMRGAVYAPKEHHFL